MFVVKKISLIIISFHIINRKTLVPRERQILTVPFKIILYVTLGTYQRTHFLRSRFCNILSLTGKSFNQGRTADMQIHILRLMTIGTTDRIDNFTAQCSPFIIIECLHTEGFHHTGYVRTLTSPAGRRLRTALIVHRSACTQRLADIFHSMHMSARRGIILRKSISGPQYHHFGPFLQHIHHYVPVKFTLEIRTGRFCPCLIFPGIIRLKLFITRFDSRNHLTFVIEHTGHFCPSFHQSRYSQSQTKYDSHCSAEQQPTLP